MFVVWSGAERGVEGGRRERARHGREQARVRAPVRRAPVHARRRAAVAGPAARPGRHHPRAAAAAAVAARPAAVAGGPGRPRPGRLAPPHAAQARQPGRAYSHLVLGDSRGVRRRNAS